MAVTAHIMPKAQLSLLGGTGVWTGALTSGTAGAYKMGLSATGPGATWTSTQWAYQYVSDYIAVYPECPATGSYARLSLTSPAVALEATANLIKWSVAAISFGSTTTISAVSAFIYTTLTGSADASWPLVGIIDFGATVSSTGGAWTYTQDTTNGLLYWTAS